jgi:hypothetical protein
MRLVRLYPESNPALFSAVSPWADIAKDNTNTKELWIDSNIQECDYIKRQPQAFDGIEKVCFYDFFHAQDYDQHISFEGIRAVAKHFPTVWYTGNAFPVENIDCQRFDYLWNRCRRAYLDGKPSWKQHPNPKIYTQHPLNFDLRTKTYMNLNHGLPFFRTKFLQKLQAYDNGYKSNVDQGQILENDYIVSNKYMIVNYNFPPAKKYFDDSYISLQIESQVGGIAKDKSVIFTEKTYDHLIQGRLVLNFGACNFYRSLANDGWHLPIGIDLSFDQIQDDSQRFEAYWQLIEQLLQLSLSDMHDLFMLNRDGIEHNYNMLRTKPYDYIN